MHVLFQVRFAIGKAVDPGHLQVLELYLGSKPISMILMLKLSLKCGCLHLKPTFRDLSLPNVTQNAHNYALALGLHINKINIESIIFNY